MRKPGLLLFLIGFLLIIIGVIIYLTVSSPKMPANAKLVLKPLHSKLNTYDPANIDSRQRKEERRHPG